MTQTIPFEDIVLQKIDNRGKTPPVFSAGYPLLEVNSLSRNRLYPDISKVSKWVNGETYASWFRQYLEKDDILFSTVGTIAESAIIPAEPIYAVAQNILGFRFKSEIIDPKYALYLMRSSWFINQITGRTIETVQKSIKWSDMRGIKINLPDLDTQEKIAAILWSLDEKIELNRQMNETLEQMGQALFRHYFIDNPEADKWKVGKFSDVTDVLTGKGSTKSQLSESGIVPLYGANGIMGTSEDYLYNEPLVITGRVGTLGMVRAVTGRAWFSDNVLIMKPKISSFGFIYHMAKSFDYISMNRGSSQPLVTQTDLKSRPIKIPDETTLTEFEDNFDALFNQQQANEKQIQTLTTLRDTLLPRLINGKVKV